MKKSEASEQAAVVEWCDVMHIPIFAIPNGGSRDKIEAYHLKKQGVKAGVPDLMIPLARYGKHGLFIEMKYGGNKPTEKQNEWIELLEQNGYMVKVCYGAEAAIRLIKCYRDNFGLRDED